MPWTETGQKSDVKGTAPAPDVEERGVLVLAVPRGRPDPDGRHWEELRISLDEFQGHPFVNVRVFVRGQDRVTWFPTKKGCSVRLAEAERVADAILEAARLADLPGGGRARTKSAPVSEDRR